MNPKPPYLALAVAAFLALPLSAGEVKEKAAGKPAPPSTEASMKVFVDPATGQVTSKPDPSSRAALASAPAVERPALKVEKVTTRAGGRKVRLDDRFKMEMTATVGPEGKVSQSCQPGQADAPTAGAPAKEHGHDR